MKIKTDVFIGFYVNYLNSILEFSSLYIQILSISKFKYTLKNSSKNSLGYSSILVSQFNPKLFCRESEFI